MAVAVKESLDIREVPAAPREIFSWCFYDFANSSFTTLIVTLASLTTSVAARRQGAQRY